MKRVSILICLLVAILGPGLQQAFAQQKTLVRGKVVSTTDGSTLPSAPVFEMDKDGRIVNTAMTDMDGNYSLLVSSMNNKLSCKFLGFKPKEVNIGGKNVVNIQMEESSVTLNEAVVTGKKQVQAGMMNIAERDLTSSMVRLDTKDIAELSAASIDDAIQGRMAGVDVVASSGDPGAGMSIRIRGTTSINGSSQPLIVVDGVIFETSTTDFDFSNANEEEYSQLLNIATDDIADIAVLKDAAATAIYGSKAANGVLQITTKRGNIGPPSVGYTYKGTYSYQPAAISTLDGDQYTTLIIESMLNAGTQMNMASNPEFAYDTNNPYYYYNYGQNTDWISEITQNGKTNDHSLSVAGGTSKVRYRFSSSYWDQTGTTIGTDFSRLSTRMNIDYDVSEKLRFSADISYTHSDNHRNYFKDIRTGAYTKMPNQSVNEYTKTGILTSNYFTPQTNQQGTYAGESDDNYNPVALANEGIYRIQSEKIIPKLNIMYRISPTWRYTVDIGFDVGNDKYKSFLPRTATGLDRTSVYVNQAFESDTEGFTMQTYNKLFWMPKLGEKHSLQILFGANTTSTTSQSYSSTTANSASSILQDPIFGTVAGNSNLSINSGMSQYRSVAAFAQVQYSLLDRYVFNATIRRDGSSKFGVNNRYGDFPSISSRWRVSGEPFMKGFSKWLTDFSIRASYGYNGNEPTYNYLQYSNYSTYSYSYLGATGTYPSGLQLSNLKWEKTTQANLAGNLILFDGRINIDYDYYYKSTDDLLFKNLTLPSSSGYGSVSYMNVGKMDNIGWELNIQTTPIKTKDWVMTFNLNVARSQNFIRSLSEYVSTESGSWSTNGSYLLKYIKNQPLGSFYGYKYEGVYLNENQTIAVDKNGNQISTYDENNNLVPLYMKFGAGTSVDYQFEAGDAKYTDVNKDGNINLQDIVYLGDANPMFFGGFGPSVTWKRRWTLSSHFNFRYGNDIVNSTKMALEKMYNYNNQSTAVLRRFRHTYETEEEIANAPSDLLPRALFGTGYNWLASDRFVEDGSFLRFRSLTLKYSFDPKLLKRWHMDALSLWFTAQNLYCWTNYTGQDPEVTISNPLTLGYDTGYAPRQKDFIIGASVNF
jgi:TonB-linked SusC/RagA family outer membrane protein